ncbi:MAG: hypothetical protein U5L08_08765 [Xanthomonadales bacterium]|nr:hypothetical protein [Xanthomonadales bacterium]
MQALSVIGLLALVAVIYYPGLSGSFIFDDSHNVVENPAVQMTSLDWVSLKEAATAYGDQFPHRPVSTISLAIDHWLWNGEAYGFKLTNLLVHLVTTFFVLLLARQLFRVASPVGSVSDSFWPALAIAAVWAIHPLQVSTVLYVVQRMEMLAALFIILSLLAYIAARVRLISGDKGGWSWMVAAGTIAMLAVFSKETGALAPFFMLALEVLLFRFQTVRQVNARVLKLGFCVVLAAALAGWLFWLLPAALSPDAYVHRNFSLDQRLWTQLRVLPMYLGWMLFPATDYFLFYYDHYPHSIGPFQPITTLLGGLFLAALLATALIVRRRAPLVALGIVWFFIAHALTSNVVALELVFEHRNYFALMAVLLALVGSLQALASKLPSASSSMLTRAAPLALVAGLCALTLIRAATWGDAMNLATHHAHINPDSSRAGLDLAELYLDWADGQPTSPFMNMARARLEKIARLPGAPITADAGLIVMAAKYGETIDLVAGENGQAGSREEVMADAAWRRLFDKTKHNPALSNNDYDAIFSLVQSRNKGLPLDDARLWRLHDIMCRRDAPPTILYVRFGYYAALTLNDMARATSAFRKALDLLADKPEQQTALKEAISAAELRLAPDIGACEAIDAGVEAAPERGSWVPK